MEDAIFASDWPGAFAKRFAAAKGTGRRRRRRLDDLERFGAARYMRGGPPFGPPMRGGALFGPPFGGGRGRRRRGDVRMALLMLLAEEPRNGYQLMQVIEERSDGSWRPSPGSVYPVLSQLEDEGLVHATERDGAKVFELTDAGRERVAETKDATPPWVLDEDDDLAGRRDVRRLVGEVAAAAMQVNHLGSPEQAQQAIDTLKTARRTLYRILAEDEEV
jgi:DNA-binding PadR family transcriptional regulator